MLRTEYLKEMRWESIKNTSEETCPAFGLFAIVGSEQVGRRTILHGEKPSTTFYREYAVNGPTAIPAGKYGRCTRMSGGLWIKYDTGTPAAGEGWGPKPGQWTASKGFPGITVEGIKDSSRTLLLGTLGEVSRLAGKADANIAALSTDTPGSGTVSIYYFNGTSYADTTMNVTAYNKSKAEVTAGEHLTLLLVNGIWEVIFESCGGGE